MVGGFRRRAASTGQARVAQLSVFRKGYNTLQGKALDEIVILTVGRQLHFECRVCRRTYDAAALARAKSGLHNCQSRREYTTLQGKAQNEYGSERVNWNPDLSLLSG